ncbi:MAG: cysteine synthase A [bacterium]
MAQTYDDLTKLIGNTPLVRIKRYFAESPARIFGKLESRNPGASVKDRIALAMIEAAEAEGRIHPGDTLIEPTSGNTGIGLAMVGAIKGYQVILTMPESMSMERRKLLRAYGAEIVLTPAKEGMKGAIAHAALLLKNIPGAFMPSQFSNPANPAVHYKTTGPEIWSALNGKVDVLVAGVGTGGTLSGAGRFLKEKNPAIRVVAVEPDASAVLSGGTPGPHMIQGIGAGFVPDNYHRDVVDEVLQVSGQAAINCAKKVARTDGLLVGISAGGNILAAGMLAARPEFADKNIVTILCDTGERYISTLLFYED